METARVEGNKYDNGPSTLHKLNITKVMSAYVMPPEGREGFKTGVFRLYERRYEDNGKPFEIPVGCEAGSVPRSIRQWVWEGDVTA